jgi:hypothetical protein
MAPAERSLPGARTTEERMGPTVDEVRIPPAGDGFYAALKRVEDNPLELLQAACEAMRLLQSRQQHIPEEHQDPRERKVLRQLRRAVRAVS